MELRAKELYDVDLPYTKLELIRGEPDGFIPLESIMNVKLKSLKWFIRNYGECYVYSMKRFDATKTVSVVYGIKEGDFTGWKN